MKIIKANGEEAIYDPKKIAHSLERAGASQKVIAEVIEKAEREIYEGIQTHELYRIVFRILKSLSRSTAGRYHLKKAIMELGPTGFPFEHFIAELLKVEGYVTKTNQILQGRCVKHEVDVVASKNGKRFMIECKFHGDEGNISDLKVALYVYARYLDLAKTRDESDRFDEGWLVTNTRISTDAEQYGVCVGLGLMSWNYPKGSSLREKIDHFGLHPITCLTSLKKFEKQLLLERKVVLCNTLCATPSILTDIGFSNERAKRVLSEAQAICTS